MTRRYANAGTPVLHCLIAQGLYLVGCAVNPEQGVVAELQNSLNVHILRPFIYTYAVIIFFPSVIFKLLSLI